MVEISNENLCMLVIVFVIVLILFNMGREDKIVRSPCMKVASKFDNSELNLYLNKAPIGIPSGFAEPTFNINNPIYQGPGQTAANNPGVAVRTAFAMDDYNQNNPISGKVGNSGGGNFSTTNIAANVNARFIYPSDVKNPQYITEFGVDKGINGVSGLNTDSYLSVYGGPFSMNISPSQSLTKN